MAAAAPCHGCSAAKSAGGASGRVGFARGHSQLHLLQNVFDTGGVACCSYCGDGGAVTRVWSARAALLLRCAFNTDT